MTEAPSYTFGHKAAFSIVKPGAAKEPSPTDHERQNADSLVPRRGPSFTHQFRHDAVYESKVTVAINDPLCC
ncbi:hypothetical protein RRG08_055288 [Elysia crispata]|uniref:Uncharacterized protein n=1 Tax=Elysia crispata TaxID=231223 RepID=A0AAE1E1C7_9GAST|nr:hypothetical protein RRG08_055288 [Elysia crispata]